MKILFITARFPYPPLKGDQAVVYHRLRTLSKHHEITLLTFYENAEDISGLSGLEPFCRGIYTVKLSKFHSLMNVVWRSGLSSLPLQVLYYQSSEFERKIDSLTKSHCFDIVHAFLLRMTPYLKNLATPKVLELIDSMQLNLQRRLLLEPTSTRWVFREELRRVIPYESKVYELADHLIVVAHKDKEFFKASSTSVIPNGVDTEVFFPKQERIQSATVVFSGNMGYAPNIHAVKWFVEHCWGNIRLKNPEAVFVIAGGNVSSDIQRLNNQNGIVVTGYVPSMADVLRKSTVAIAPMQSGSGIQNKILEAMACALPVVTTSLGLGSIQASHNENVFVCDAPHEFSSCVIGLLNNPDNCNMVGEKARKYVAKWHSWERAAEMVDKIYSDIVESKG